MEDLKVIKKRSRDEIESESEFDSPEVKRLKENLLETLDDDDDDEVCTANLDLDSFMKSFEKEITSSPVDLTSESGESRPEIGYLLEASDDDLGIPPTTSSPRVDKNDFSELNSEFWGFEGENPGYDSYGFGLGETDNFNGEYVALDGLFDHSDMGHGAGDFEWRPGTF